MIVTADEAAGHAMQMEKRYMEYFTGNYSVRHSSLSVALIY